MSTIAVRDPQNLLHRRPLLGRRIAPRRRLAVPVNVTVLRSGVPDAVPGRSIDVCEGGVGAVLAAQLFPGELVGVEFRLPDASSILAKARVCYQERLRCGLQFLAIPAEQRAMLGAWTLGGPERGGHSADEALVNPPAREPDRSQPPVPKFLSDVSSEGKTSTPRYLRRKILMLLVTSVIVAAGVGWWQWEQSWQELESHLPGRAVEAAQAPVAVPADVMQHLLVHRVEPMSPGGRKVGGVAVLAAVIGRDGSVMSLRPVSGPDVLTRAAMDSVQWWKFEPYRLNGTPIEVETTLAVEFR
jgi:outer membrane biosynthesis protein TonB